MADDADVVAGDEKGHRLMLVRSADADVVEPAEVAKGDVTIGVDLVVACAEVDSLRGVVRCGFEARVKDVERRGAVQGAVRSLLVVVGAEGVERGLNEWQ